MKDNFILTYGPSTPDTKFTSSVPDGSVNASLSFSLPYQNSLYNSIQINVNGFVVLNGTALIYAFANNLFTNGSDGAVYFRQVNTSSTELSTLTTRVVQTHSNFSQFSAAQAFVVTWFNLASVSNANQLNSFQMILVTDYLSSFVLFNYQRLDSTSQLACTVMGANSTSVVSMTNSRNCTESGSLVANINAGGMQQKRTSKLHFWIKILEINYFEKFTLQQLPQPQLRPALWVNRKKKKTIHYLNYLFKINPQKKGSFILNYGANVGDASFENASTGDSVNASLSFSLPYQNLLYNSIQINVNGFVALNGSVPIFAFGQNFFTNGIGGSVFYREVNTSSSELSVLTSRVVSTFSNFSSFSASRAFVVTWCVIFVYFTGFSC